MNDFFGPEFFSSNRSRLQAVTEAELIVLPANGLLQRNADNTFPFRQDSNFFYLTGINEQDFVLVISSDSTFLIEPKIGEYRSVMEANYNKEHLSAVSGITELVEHHAGWTQLDLLIRKYKKVHTVTPAEAYIDHYGFYANPARGHLLEELKKHRKVELIDIRKDIARLRQIKQAPELNAIRHAIEITGRALSTVKKNIKSYKFEYEAAADITKEFMGSGFREHSFHPIVAAGKNATVIHNFKNSDAIKPGDLLLLDIGAEVEGYSADITRTYAISQPTKRQKQVFDAVRRVQEAAYKLLRPGVDMKAYEQEVDLIMAKELKRLKLLNDVSNKKKLKKYYPHLTSHFLGLDTHDAADYQLPLAPGMVLTVEPGIYIAEEGIGIRVEDDVLVTETGVEVLSRALPLELN